MRRKVGAAVLRNTRRVRILFTSHHPLREVFLTAARAPFEEMLDL